MSVVIFVESKSKPVAMSPAVPEVEEMRIASRTVPAVFSAFVRQRRHSKELAPALSEATDSICRPNRSASASSAVRLNSAAKKSSAAVAPLLTT